MFVVTVKAEILGTGSKVINMVFDLITNHALKYDFYFSKAIKSKFNKVHVTLWDATNC